MVDVSAGGSLEWAYFAKTFYIRPTSNSIIHQQHYSRTPSMENLQANILFYNSPAGNVKVEVIFSDETFWLNQKRLAELFGVDVRTINEHLQNIFSSGELERDPTIRKIRIVQKEGSRNVTREVDFYNLDAAIAVGYRVNSFQATQFRIWATRTKIPMKMADWAGKLDAFLQFNEYEILKDAGKVSHEVAMRLAEEQFEKFRVDQDKNFESDFDKELKKWKLM